MELKYDNVVTDNSDKELTEQIKQMKKDFDIAPEDSVILLSFKEVLDTIAKFYNKDGKPVTTMFKEADTAFCTENNQIVLPPKLILEFCLNNLPKFCVFYHELGHALYSEPAFHLIEKWKNISSAFASHMYSSKYLYLFNWIEDYYIEEKLVKTFPYLQDIIKCLGLLPHQYDDQKREFAFHYYYTHKKPSPSFNQNESAVFIKYLNDLKILRQSNMYGVGPLSLLSKNNVNMRFISKLKDFYTWCVQMKIFPDMPIPPLSLPSNTITYVQDPNAQGKGGNAGNAGDQYGNGSYSDHSSIVGVKAVQEFPKLDPNATVDPIILNQFKAEKVYMKKALNSYRHDTQKNNLYGVFTTEYDASNILGAPIIPNFFNTNRLEDQVLFKQPGRTFNNVSIYRDISGSTCGEVFTLIDKVCNYLDKNIPIDKHFYLYSSGEISIMETEYQEWEDSDDEPELYRDDPIYQQMGGGTNSDAIADVMSEQLNDKWLNIIVTDGDLYQLFQRGNIEALLHNIAVIEVDTYKHSGDSSCKQSMGMFGDHYVYVHDESDIPNINDMLYNLKEEIS